MCVYTRDGSTISVSIFDLKNKKGNAWWSKETKKKEEKIDMLYTNYSIRQIE